MTTLSRHRAHVQAPAPTAGAPLAIRADGLSKQIDDRTVLAGINLEIASGTTVALLGANGAGKSTLLRTFAMLIPPTAGRLELFGHPAAGATPAIRARIGMIGHRLMLYRDLSVRENLQFFGRLYRVAGAGARAQELLELVGLTDRADDPVRSLSRGMAQRAAIARALMHSPELLLADEPFAGLDAVSERLVERALADLRAGGTTIVMASHDVRQSFSLAQRVVVLREGRISVDAPAADLSEASVLDALGVTP